MRFKGIKGSANESWDESEQKVKHFILDTLNVPEMVDVQIERAHRIGSKRPDNCPIIAKFSRFKDGDLILRRAREQFKSNSSLAVKEDFSEGVMYQRLELGKELLKARDNGRYASMRYDKLIIDDRVYKYNTVRQSVECIGKARTHASSQDLRLGVQHGNNKGLDNPLTRHEATGLDQSDADRDNEIEALGGTK